MLLAAKMIIAGLREEGTICRRCQKEIVAGDQTAACPDCGGIHHWVCWSDGSGCGAYECPSANRSIETRSDNGSGAEVIHVSNDELASVTPLPLPRATAAGWIPQVNAHPVPAGPKRWSRLAITSLAIAVIGVPLFGIVTGLIAVIIGCLALSGHSRQWKGAAMAVAGIVLGIVDVAGWTVGLIMILDTPALNVTTIDQFEPDPKALQELPAAINRAMKSNVLIQTTTGFSLLHGAGIGSGVIVRIANGTAWIVTNRHVADSGFAPDRSGSSSELPKGTQLSVKSVGQPMTAGQLVWVAPHGIDLAVITMPVTSQEAVSAEWDDVPKTTVGEEVFAIGNPHGLGWTYTPGGISQMRLQARGPMSIRIIQTSAAINPGNSGGGLYDRNGRLVGINTWTKDKRFAEGLSFSIAFHTLLPILPAEFGISDRHFEDGTP